MSKLRRNRYSIKITLRRPLMLHIPYMKEGKGYSKEDRKWQILTTLALKGALSIYGLAKEISFYTHEKKSSVRIAIYRVLNELIASNLVCTVPTDRENKVYLTPTGVLELLMGLTPTYDVFVASHALLTHRRSIAEGLEFLIYYILLSKKEIIDILKGSYMEDFERHWLSKMDENLIKRSRDLNTLKRNIRKVLSLLREEFLKAFLPFPKDFTFSHEIIEERKSFYMKEGINYQDWLSLMHLILKDVLVFISIEPYVKEDFLSYLLNVFPVLSVELRKSLLNLLLESFELSLRNVMNIYKFFTSISKEYIEYTGRILDKLKDYDLVRINKKELKELEGLKEEKTKALNWLNP